MTHEQKEHWLFTAKFACCSLLASSLLARLESHLTPTQPRSSSSSLLTISIKLQYKKKVVCQPHFRFFGCSFLWPQSMLLSVSHDNHKDFLQKWISAYVVHSMYLTFVPTYLHPSSTRWKIQADRPAKVCTTNSPVISCFKCNGVKMWLTLINHQHWQ